MKRILVLSTLLFLFGCKPKDLPTHFVQKEDFALVMLSHLTTKAEMVDIQEKLTEQGFVIDFTGSEFFEDGKLRNLKLKVTSPKGSGGMTSADQVTLQFKYWGFIYDKDGNPTLKIGEMTDVRY